MFHANPLLMPNPFGSASDVIRDRVFGPRPGAPGLAGTPGTYGDSTHYPVITTDLLGRVVNVTSQAVPSSSVGSTNLTADAILAMRDFSARILVGVQGVSVATANGVSATVAFASSYPVITFTLGAITPTSVAATGAVTGSNLSGTNTGDQNLTPYALLASPAFSGVPTAPTAALGTSTTQIATTQFCLVALINYSLQIANNLSELAATAGTARSNLGLGSLATQSGTFSGTHSGTSSGTNTGDQASVSGNAGTATILATARTINGVSFDGSANITVTAAAGTLTGAALASGVTSSSLTSFGVSPVLAGTPTAPTATAGTSTTQVATTAFVATSFAPLASPALTGTPTAPTASPGTSTTQLATTAFVQAALPAVDQGTFEARLTLTSGTPVTTADVTGATTVYLTPFRGSRISLYTSSAWASYALSEISLALGTLTSSTNYDVYVYDSGGTPTLQAVAWTSNTARATALTTQDGVLVKSGDTAKRYAGTFRTTSTTTTEDSARRRFVYSYGGRVRKPLQRFETASSWTYATASFRQANANALNQVEIVQGWAESLIDLSLQSEVQAASTAAFNIRIGLDSTTAGATNQMGGNTVCTPYGILASQVNEVPAVGYHFYSWLENAASAVSCTVFQSGGLSGNWEC